MRIDKVSGAPVDLKTQRVVWRELEKVKPNYYHAISWEPSGDCPPGFLAQKIKRDIKYSVGRLSGTAWTWGLELKEEAEYWEIWEVVVIDKDTRQIDEIPHLAQNVYVKMGLKRVRIYPGIMADSSAVRYATSWGERLEAQLKADTAEKYKRPAPSPADCEYWAHDTFTESRPKPIRPAKGTFKIKGVVYFLPSGDRSAEDWVADFLRLAQRGYKTATGYTGGALWQNAGRHADPASKYKIMTRYEAGQFYNVARSDLIPKTGLAVRVTNAPDVKDEWKERDYPVGLLG